MAVLCFESAEILRCYGIVTGFVAHGWDATAGATGGKSAVRTLSNVMGALSRWWAVRLPLLARPK